MVRQLFLTVLSIYMSTSPALLLADPANTKLLTLEAVRQAALRSPRAAAIDSVFASQGAAGLKLRLWENPEFEAGVHVPVSYEEARGENEVELSLTQPLRPSDFGSGKQASDALAARAEDERKTALEELLHEVSLVFFNTWILEERRGALLLQRNQGQKLAKALQEGAKEGRSDESEVKLFLAEAAEASAELLDIEASITEARRDLAKLTALPIEGVTLQEPLLGELPDVQHFVSRVKASSKGMAARLARREEAERRLLRSVQSNAFPGFAPSLIYSKNEEGSEYVGVGVRLSVPLWNQNSADRLEQEARVREASSLRAYSESDGFMDELRATHALYNLRTSQAALYREKILPNLRSAMSLTEARVAAGAASPLQLWQIRRRLQEAESAFLSRRLEQYRASLDLLLLSGELL